MNDAVRIIWPALAAALLVMMLPHSADAEDADRMALEGDEAVLDADAALELHPALQRSPFFVSFDAGLGPRFGLASSWDTTVAMGGEVNAGLGMWRGERMALFANVGVINMAGISVDRFRAPGTVEERFRLLPVRMGAKLNLRPRPSWLELNVMGAASVAMGKRDLVLGNSNSRIAASETVFSVGGGGGVELAMVKFKTTGVTLKGEYYFQPTSLDDEAGFITGGFTDLGGATLSVGVVYFLGGPQ